MVGDERGMRLRAAMDNYFTLVVLALVVLALAGGYLTFLAYEQRETRTETVETASWESSGEFSHRATVVNGTDVYDRGETLRNRDSYFQAITPRLNGTFTYTYTATGSGNLSVTATTVLVLRSVTEDASTAAGTAAAGDDGNTTEYWRLESTLGTREVTSLAPGDAVEVPFSLNVSAAAARLERVDEQFGGTPGEKQLFVETRVQLTGTRNGQPVETTRVYELPIAVTGNVYEVGDSGPVTHSDSQTAQRTVVVEPGPVQRYGGPLILGAALLGAAVLGGARARGQLSVTEREREWLRYRTHREELADWITGIRLPPADRPDSTVAVDTLEGLVDIAIDTDRRVLEDRARGEYLVFGEDRTYSYRPPTAAGDPLGDATTGETRQPRQTGAETVDTRDGSEATPTDADDDSGSGGEAGAAGGAATADAGPDDAHDDATQEE